MIQRITHYAYVRHADWPRWTRLGWTYHCELGPPHGTYSALFEWHGAGDPAMPGQTDPPTHERRGDEPRGASLGGRAANRGCAR